MLYTFPNLQANPPGSKMVVFPIDKNILMCGRLQSDSFITPAVTYT